MTSGFPGSRNEYIILPFSLVQVPICETRVRNIFGVRLVFTYVNTAERWRVTEGH